MQCTSDHLHSTDQGPVVTEQEGGSPKWGVLRKQPQGGRRCFSHLPLHKDDFRPGIRNLTGQAAGRREDLSQNLSPC